MNKVLIILGLMVFFCTNVNAQQVCPLVMEDNRTISVSANASREVSPDTVEINIEIQTEDNKSMQIAMTKNNEISLKVIEGLKQDIDTEKGDYLKTSDYRADSLYQYINSKRIFDKYQVSNTVIVHTQSIDKIPTIIEKAVSYGATGVSNLNFSVSSYDQYKDELLTIAIKKAEKQAKTAATAAGATIKGIKSLNITSNENTYARYRNAAVNFKAMDSASGAVAESIAPSIEPGIIKIQSGVSIIYLIK